MNDSSKGNSVENTKATGRYSKSKSQKENISPDHSKAATIPVCLKFSSFRFAYGIYYCNFPIILQANRKLTVGKVKRAPNIGDLCFGKIKGYAEWPAHVDSIEGNCAWITFFNSDTVGKCSFNKIFDLEEGVRFLDKYVNKHKAFTKAVKEMAFIMRDKMKNSKSLSDNKVIKRYIDLIE